MQERLDIYKRLAPGEIAPDFDVALPNDVILSLYEIEAEYTVIAFWGSWCGHCKNILPGVHQYLSQQNGTVVIAIGLDEDEADWQKEIGEYPKWINMRLANKWNDEISIDYGIYATPTFYVLNKDKKILGKCKNLHEIKALL